jgi:hypothetical protein
MGYSGLESWVDSDGAADLRSRIQEGSDLDSLLKEAIADPGNEYNPEGCVDVALLLEGGVITAKEVGIKNLQAICRRLSKLIKSCEGEGENEVYHRESCERLLGSVKSFMRNHL